MLIKIMFGGSHTSCKPRELGPQACMEITGHLAPLSQTRFISLGARKNSLFLRPSGVVRFPTDMEIIPAV